jgi:hypothetical protein
VVYKTSTKTKVKRKLKTSTKTKSEEDTDNQDRDKKGEDEEDDDAEEDAMSGLAAGFNDKNDIKEEFPSLEIVVPILCDKISNNVEDNVENLESNEGTKPEDGGTKEGMAT